MSSAEILEFPRPAEPIAPSPTDGDEIFSALRLLNDDVKALWDQSRQMDALMFRIRWKILELGKARKAEKEQ
jgi:hypothetical protein